MALETVPILGQAKLRIREEERARRVQKVYDLLAELKKSEEEYANLGKKIEGLKSSIEKQAWWTTEVVDTDSPQA